jgi:hypothetical protein
MRGEAEDGHHLTYISVSPFIKWSNLIVSNLESSCEDQQEIIQQVSCSINATFFYSYMRTLNMYKILLTHNGFIN